MAKLWYGPEHECNCGALVTPEFSNGFWRIPAHTIEQRVRGRLKTLPCLHVGKQIVARYGSGND